MTRNNKLGYTPIEIFVILAILVSLFAWGAARFHASFNEHNAVFDKVKTEVEARGIDSPSAVVILAREMLSDEELRVFVAFNPGYLPRTATKGPTLVRLPEGGSSAVVPVFVTAGH